LACFSAIRPGTHLPAYARQLVRVRDAVISGTRPSARPRALVARSWARVMQAGLDGSVALTWRTEAVRVA